MKETAGLGQGRSAAGAREDGTRDGGEAQRRKKRHTAQRQSDLIDGGNLEMVQGLEQARKVDRVLLARILRRGAGAMMLPGDPQERKTEQIVTITDDGE